LESIIKEKNKSQTIRISSSKTNSLLLFGIRYIYLALFFVLLAGFFHPLITNRSFDPVFLGVFVLSIGLAGAILIYKVTQSDKRRTIYLGGGFALLGISIYLIHDIAGRPLF